jgi:hypothetical protein
MATLVVFKFPTADFTKPCYMERNTLKNPTTWSRGRESCKCLQRFLHDSLSYERRSIHLGGGRASNR